MSGFQHELFHFADPLLLCCIAHGAGRALFSGHHRLLGLKYFWLPIYRWPTASSHLHQHSTTSSEIINRLQEKKIISVKCKSNISRNLTGSTGCGKDSENQHFIDW